MSQKNVRWLYGEIPQLVERGVLPSEVAVRIRQHYGAVEGGRKWAVVLCAILGALLVGGGVILLLAHNWDQLSRPVRTVLSLTPLLLSQLLAAWVLLRQAGSVAWREGVGVGWVVSVAAALALIGQTYHMPGDLGGFLLTWALLSLPVAYLLAATTPWVLYLAGITAWAGDTATSGETGLLFWPLVAAVLPFFWHLVKSHRHGAWQGLLGWTLALALIFGTGFTLHDTWGQGWVLAYGALLSGLFLLGEAPSGNPKSWQRPLRTAGLLGIVGLSVVLSFGELWDELRFTSSALTTVEDGAGVALCGLLVAVSLTLMYLHRGDGARTILTGGFGVLTLGAWGLAWAEAPLLSTLLFNAYLLSLGVVHLADGVSLRSLARANAGVAILTLLAVTRFFDADLSFILRGILFIVVGSGFLFTNLYLIRTRRKVTS